MSELAQGILLGGAIATGAARREIRKYDAALDSAYSSIRAGARREHSANDDYYSLLAERNALLAMLNQVNAEKVELQDAICMLEDENNLLTNQLMAFRTSH